MSTCMCKCTWQEFLHIPIWIFVFISRELLAEDCLPPFSHWNLTSFMSTSVSRPHVRTQSVTYNHFHSKSECIYRCFDYSINYWPIHWIVNISCVQFQQLHIKYIFVMEISLPLFFLAEIESDAIYLRVITTFQKSLLFKSLGFPCCNCQARKRGLLVQSRGSPMTHSAPYSICFPAWETFG